MNKKIRIMITCSLYELLILKVVDNYFVDTKKE